MVNGELRIANGRQRRGLLPATRLFSSVSVPQAWGLIGTIRFCSITDELHEHYDFDYSKAKPSRFATRLTQEQLMVVIDPDLAVIFPTSEAVNEALRVLATAAQNLPHTTPKRSRKPRKATAVSGV